MSRLITQTVVVLFSFALLASATADEIKPLNQWSGMVETNKLRPLCPENNVIDNEKTWKQICSKWRSKEPIPKINFQTDMVVAVMAEGPNYISIADFKLVRGNLKFQAIATEMGGPGFCFLLLKFPKENITAINGRLIGSKPKVEISQPFRDHIRVNVVGTIKTGQAAIGGETTGNTITCNDITWELEFPKDIHRPLEQFNGLRARIGGELFKRKGVEIKERWIVKVDHLEPVTKNGMRKVPADIPRSIQKSFNRIVVKQSGGFAGVSITTTVDADGKTNRINRRDRVDESWNIKPVNLYGLHRFVANTDWSKITKEVKVHKSINAADLFQYEITIETKKATHRFLVDDLGLKVVLPLQKLLRKLQ